MLVLTDLQMPGMDGIALLREIRARHPDTAVVMITGVSDVDVAVRCLGIGAMDYLDQALQPRGGAGPASRRHSRSASWSSRDATIRPVSRSVSTPRPSGSKSLFLASMQAFAAALEAKDRYTRGHSVRVSHYSVAIAHALRLDSETVRQVGIGGHLHDIGKMGVRESVLNKNGPADRRGIPAHHDPPDDRVADPVAPC